MPATTGSVPLPEPLIAVLAEFAELAPSDRVTLLLEYGDEIPSLPARYADPPAAMDRVTECQSPVYLAIEADPQRQEGILLFVSAPPQAPVTRGFAGLVCELSRALSAQQVSQLPPDLATRLGLGEAISPLRLHAMAGLLARVRRAAALV